MKIIEHEGYEYAVLVAGAPFYEQGDEHKHHENFLSIAKEGSLLIRRKKGSTRRGGPSHQIPAWFTVEGEQAHVIRQWSTRKPFLFPPKPIPTVMFVSEENLQTASLNRIENPIQAALI